MALHKKNPMNDGVNWFFEQNSPWQNEYKELRKIVLETLLTEELKWGCPCYTLKQKNIVLIHGFKAYCALLFMKGALLKDKEKMLVQQTKNVQSARQLRFKNVSEILNNKEQIKQYIIEAINLEKSGIKYIFKETSEINYPEEFKISMAQNKALKTAFEALTPGRQRAYLHYFTQAKKSETRIARIEKYTPFILDGKGLNEVN
jgi:uncharacterized protein YdeI (YjbR/CyaY-like superfamily)